MNRASFLLFKTITRIMLVVGIALGIMLIPNLSIFDEDLLPEIIEHLSKSVNPDIEGNAAYDLYGIEAATGKDPHIVGKAVVKTLQSKHAKNEFAVLAEEEIITLYGGLDNGDKEWQATYPAAACNPRQNPGCFTELLAQIKAQPFAQPRLQTQLKRYNNIIKISHLIEQTRLMDYTSPVPHYSIIMQMGSLNQANAYLASGIEGLITSSQADMQFWRMALTDNQTLIGKMVTLATLRRSLIALSYAIKKETNLTPIQVQNLQHLLKPLTSDEVNISEALTTELRFDTENWETTPKSVPEENPQFSMP